MDHSTAPSTTCSITIDVSQLERQHQQLTQRRTSTIARYHKHNYDNTSTNKVHLDTDGSSKPWPYPHGTTRKTSRCNQRSYSSTDPSHRFLSFPLHLLQKTNAAIRRHLAQIYNFGQYCQTDSCSTHKMENALRWKPDQEDMIGIHPSDFNATQKFAE